MLLAAVAQELVPPLSAAHQITDVIAILIGFSLGVALMIGLGMLVEDEEQEEELEMKENMMQDAEAHAEADGGSAPKEPSEPSESGRSGRSHESIGTRSNASAKRSKSFTSFRINEKNNKASAKIVIPSFPVAFAVAVYIDSAMDGPNERSRNEGVAREILPEGEIQCIR